MPNRFVLVMLALAAVACGAPDQPGEPTAPPTTAPEAATPPGRRLTDTERAAMMAVLGAEQDEGRTAWFALAPGDPEAAALKDALEAVFKQSGWRTETQTVTGMVLKPGLSMLIASEQPPAYVARAQEALEATGFEWKVGTGYGPYYEERRRADPNWPGIALAPGQDFVIVVGPKAPAR